MEVYYSLNKVFYLQVGGEIPAGATVFETLEDFEFAKELEVGQPPDWDGFTSALLSDDRLNKVLGEAFVKAPAVALGVTVALGQVAKDGPSAFSVAFPALCQLGGATQKDVESWATMASDHNLPRDFVAVIMDVIPPK